MEGTSAAATYTRDPLALPSSTDLAKVGTTATNRTRTMKFSSGSTEYSTAIMTGLVPSDLNNSNYYSGGAHNFPRFLENHYRDLDGSGLGVRTIAMRGSFVAMYESTVGVEPWSLRIYEAPNRLWGFNDLFANGQFPPLTPKVMSYRRVDFTDINKTQYDALKSGWGL